MIIHRLFYCIASIILEEVPDAISILGYIIICGAGVAMFVIRKKKETEAEEVQEK